MVRKAIMVSLAFHKWVESKRKKNESQGECLYRLTGYIKPITKTENKNLVAQKSKLGRTVRK